MINSLKIIEQEQVVGNIVNDLYKLPSWEILKSFTMKKNIYLFFNKEIDVNLLHKFSSKSMLEKYKINSKNGETLASMDLMVYKDCIYIVELKVKSSEYLMGAVEGFLSAVKEKAKEETTDNKIFINLSSDFKYKNSLKRILVKNGFQLNENQSNYEMEIIGELYQLN